MNIDITPFENAINSLKIVIELYNKNTNDDIIRDSMIQRFEYTYSLALKMITRFIGANSYENVQGLTFNQIIRIANKYGLLKTNLETWDKYRQKRNLTSHTYDLKTALKVVEIIEEFNNEAEFLLNMLKEKIDG